MYTIERLPDDAVAILTYTDPLNREDIEAASREAFEFVASLPSGTVTLIHDVTELDLSFGKLVGRLIDGLRPGDPEVQEMMSTHRDRTRSIVVGTGPMINLIATGGRQAQYGSWSMRTADTLAEALEYAKEPTLND